MARRFIVSIVATLTIVTAVIAVRHSRPRATAPRVFVTTGDDFPPLACPVNRVGLSREGTLIGVSAPVSVCGNATDAIWLDPMQQCRLLLFEEAVALQQVVAAAALRFSEPTQLGPLDLPCGTVGASVASDDTLQWSLWGCDTVIWFNADTVQTWQRRTLYTLTRSPALPSSTIRRHGPQYSFNGANDCEAVMSYLKGEPFNGRDFDLEHYFWPRGEI